MRVRACETESVRRWQAENLEGGREVKGEKGDQWCLRDTESCGEHISLPKPKVPEVTVDI